MRITFSKVYLLLLHLLAGREGVKFFFFPACNNPCTRPGVSTAPAFLSPPDGDMASLTGRDRSTKGSTIADVDVTGHLSTVLSCLESLQDLIRCSAVSKSWREASQKVQPVSLDMPIDRWTSASEDKVAQVESILHYLQLQVRKGRFCNLHRLQVSLHCITGATETTQDLMRSVLTLAGSWELHSCHIHGCFTLGAAITLLPSCLQHIALSSVGVELPARDYKLDKLGRFCDLHTLQLGSDRAGPPSTLYLSRPVNLSTLQVHGNLIITYLGLPCLLLPKLRHIAGTVYEHELQEILDMPHLVYASLRVYCEDDDDVEVRIKAGSQLRRLKLTASSLNNAGDVKLQLSVLQPLLSYYVHSGGVKVKHNYGRLVPPPYAPPLLFKVDNNLM